MVQPKEWDWKLADKKLWTNPCEESYYYVNKWQQEGRRSVLDLGCGLGRHAILFAKHGFKVTAVDLSEEGIRYLRDWKQREKVDLLCKVCDMNQLPFADNAFDCIWAYHVISHTDFIGLQHIITEIKRVLKPEGQFFLTLCSKEAWAYKDAGYNQIDSNTIIKTEGPEIDVPHVYVDLEDIQFLFSEFSLNNIRHIEECYADERKGKSIHYFIEGVLHKEGCLSIRG